LFFLCKIAGFLVKDESIDVYEQQQGDESSSEKNKYNIPAQQINVYDRKVLYDSDDTDEDEVIVNNNEESKEGIILDEHIWKVLQPWIPKITQIVKDNRNKAEFNKLYPNNPNREPSLDWIFFRKYSPDDERNSLKHHHDTNMNTVNIELSNDYEGGGIFYIKPLASTGNISRVYEERGYEWINTLKRENTTSLVFPDLHAGDAIFYNYTVEHGVAPCESGTRVRVYQYIDM